MRWIALSCAALASCLAASLELPKDWQRARDAQDRAGLDRIAAQANAAAQGKPNDAQAAYQAALANSLRAEVSIEQRDKGTARAAADAGMRSAQHAVDLQPRNAEYHRMLGTLCGQAIQDLMSGLRYGKCAQEEVNKAIELEPNSSQMWLSRAVGNYYLPPQFNGGPEVAVKDLQKALQLDPKNADAHLWMGIVLRKLNRNADARKEFETSLTLNPSRVWAKQQLDKTPAK